MSTEDPRKHKELGRKVKGFVPEVWDAVSLDIVIQGNLAKFRQNPSLKDKLLATGDKILAEASPFDAEWGIGMRAYDPDVLNPRKWRGKNKLGEALMDVRRQIKEELYAGEVAGGVTGEEERTTGSSGESCTGSDADEKMPGGARGHG